MLLLDRTLLKLAQGLWKWIIAIAAVRFLALAGIDDFIRTLPEGYETQMGQMGARLSGGERQRVGIARIMLANPDIIVMDEPASSLDVLHEKELLHTLKKEYAGRTVIMISHRMSTLTGCTRLLRLENGKLTEL